MRIASLVPSATEMLFALGLGDRVAAVTHECDYPPGAEQLPHLTRSVIPEGLPAAEIDAAVRERTGRGESLYELDEDTLEELGVDLIVTQAVCEVCAVSFDDVRAVAERLPTHPQVISLDPSTLGEVLADVPRLAEAAGAEEAGEELAEEAAARIEAVERAVEGAPRPRVAALEWLDPLYIGGHWVPQMIELAGGVDVLGMPGEKSRTAEWAELEALRPDVIVSMPCGYYAEQAAAETMKQRERLAPLGARVVAVDAAAYFSRPGPRLVEGVELLGHLLHPELVPAPPTRRSIELDLSAARTRRRSSRPPRGRRAPRTASWRPPPAARIRSPQLHEHERRERAADEPADVAADRDVRDRERDQQVQPDPDAEAALHQAEAAVARDHGRGGHEAEDRPGGAHRQARPAGR